MVKRWWIFLFLPGSAWFGHDQRFTERAQNEMALKLLAQDVRRRQWWRESCVAYVMNNAALRMRRRHQSVCPVFISFHLTSHRHRLPVFHQTTTQPPFHSSYERTESQFLRYVCVASDPTPLSIHVWDKHAYFPACPTDPFADEGDPLGDSADVGSTADYIHIRIQQRNGRKTLTTLQGLPKRPSLATSYL